MPFEYAPASNLTTINAGSPLASPVAGARPAVITEVATPATAPASNSSPPFWRDAIRRPGATPTTTQVFTQNGAPDVGSTYYTPQTGDFRAVPRPSDAPRLNPVNQTAQPPTPKTGASPVNRGAGSVSAPRVANPGASVNPRIPRVSPSGGAAGGLAKAMGSPWLALGMMALQSEMSRRGIPTREEQNQALYDAGELSNIPDWLLPGLGVYPNQLDPDAMGQGPMLDEGQPPPFTGGQSAVKYNVTMTREGPQATTGAGACWGSFTSTSTTTAWGPISGVKLGTEDHCVGGSGTAKKGLFLICWGPGSQPRRAAAVEMSVSSGGVRTASIVSVTRQDGQPDTGGDPPGGVDPTYAPNPARTPTRQPNPTRPWEPPNQLPTPPVPTVPAPTPEAPPALPWPQSEPIRPPDTQPLAPPAPAPAPFSPTAPNPNPNTPTNPNAPPGPPDLDPNAPPRDAPDLATDPDTPPKPDPTGGKLKDGTNAGDLPRSFELPDGTIITDHPDGSRTIDSPTDSPWLPQLHGLAAAATLPGILPVPVSVGRVAPATTPSPPSLVPRTPTNPNVQPVQPPVRQTPTEGPKGTCFYEFNRVADIQRRAADTQQRAANPVSGFPGLYGLQIESRTKLGQTFDNTQQTKERIRPEDFPIMVPDQIAKANPQMIAINSLAELGVWIVKQLDGVVGKWPMEVPVPGVSQALAVPNISEAVAEMFGMMISQQVTAAQILNTSSRTLAQAGSATQQAMLAGQIAKGNAEFLGYEARPKAVEMPLTYTPGKEPGEGLLEEGKAMVKGWENTEGSNLKNSLAELLHAAAIIRAVYWRKLDTKGDFSDQIDKIVKQQSGFLDDLADEPSKRKEGDWEQFLEDVQRGFEDLTNKPGYNREPGEGPKIIDHSPKVKED